MESFEIKLSGSMPVVPQRMDHEYAQCHKQLQHYDGTDQSN